MPVMRSFSSFAPTPNLGGAYVGGAGVGVRMVEAENALALGRAKIAADMAQANKMAAVRQQEAQMEAQARSEALQAATLRQQQEIEVQKAYQQAQLGLKERELSQADALMKLKTQEAAQEFDAFQNYQKDAADLIAGKVDPNKAYEQSALKWGPRLRLPAGAYTQAFKPDAAQMGEGSIGTVSDVEGLPGYKKFRTGEGSFQLVRPPVDMDVEAPAGYQRFGDRLVPERESLGTANARKDLTRLRAEHKSDTVGALAALRLMQNKGSLKPELKALAEKYNAREAEIEALKKKVEQGGSKGQSGSNKWVRDKSGNMVPSEQ